MVSKLSIIIPTLNSAQKILPTLECLVEATVSGFIKQVIFADGGSDDITPSIAEEVGADLVSCPKGRGVQFKIAVIYAKADWLLFLHDDGVLTEGWEDEVGAFINDEANDRKCAYFKFALNSKSIRAKIVAFGVYWRCKIFALPYGDQGLLIKRKLYEDIGGFGTIPIMEDVEMIGRIKRNIGRKNLIMLDNRLKTAADKYADGYLKRIIRNFTYLMRYKLGSDPKAIAETYYK